MQLLDFAREIELEIRRGQRPRVRPPMRGASLRVIRHIN
jgi:hypothetical protein